MDKRDGGRDGEKRENFSRDNEQRRPRNNRDQQQSRDTQAGDDEPRQQRNRNQRNDRDNNRRQAPKEEITALPVDVSTSEVALQDEGDDQRPSKRPAGRRTRSQQRRRTRHGSEVAEGENASLNTEEKEVIAPTASDEPKVLSESAQLAQQISAAIAEHAQQAQISKPEPVADAEKQEQPAETASPINADTVIDAVAKPAAMEIEMPRDDIRSETDVAPEVIKVAEPVITESAAAVAPEVEIETSERKTITEITIAPPARASNDPRKAPKPVSQVSIITETIETHASHALDTSLPPSVDHNPRPLSRPSNDRSLRPQ